MNAKDVTTQNLKIHNLVYGRSGTGKTTWACGFPRPFVFDFDGGMLSQRGRDVEFETYGLPGEAKGVAFQKFDSRLRDIENNPSQYETYILDSITTMQEYKMDFIVAHTGKARPTQYEWGVLVQDLADLMKRLNQLPANIIVIAHEAVVQDSLTGEILVEPVIYGKKLPANLPLWFDEVYRSQVSRTIEGAAKYEMLTWASTKFYAKSRLGCLPETVVWSKDGRPQNSYEILGSYMKGGGV